MYTVCCLARKYWSQVTIDTTDKTYQKWKNEKISLSEFLRYAVNKEWIDISSLNISSKYNDTEEIMKALAAYVEDAWLSCRWFWYDSLRTSIMKEN